MNETNGLIVVKQLPVIEERLQSVKPVIQTKVQEALSLACTEENRQEIKKLRADMNKEFSALEEQRKAVKKGVLEPYERFEKVYQDCVSALYRQADRELKQKIDDVENGIRQDKQDELEAYYTEVALSYGIPEDTFSFADCGIKVNLSTTVSSAKKKIVSALERVKGELDYISGMDYAAEILIEYKKSHNAITAAQLVEQRHAQMEAEQQRLAEANARRQAEQQHQQEIVDIVTEAESREVPEQVMQPPVELKPETEPITSESVPAAEKVYEARFAVRGTIEQLKALKAFLTEGGYTYESI